MSQYESQEDSQSYFDQSYTEDQEMPAPKNYKRRYSGPQGGIVKRAASDHQKIVRLQRSLLSHRQTGYADNYISNTAVSTGGSNVYPLLYVPTNTDTSAAYRRIGDTIGITKLTVQVQLTGGETGAVLTADFFNNIGMRIGIIKNPNGAVAPTGVGNSKVALMDTGGTTNYGMYLLPPLGFDVKDDFRVLAEKTFTVAGLDTAVNSTYVKDHTATYRRTFRFKTPLKVEFNSTANAITSFEKNCPVIMFSSDSSIAPNPQFSWWCRAEYDM